MNIYRLVLAIVIFISTLNATEYTFTKTAPFNPLLVNGYESCEANATKMIREEAIKEYIGCDTDTKAYKIDVTKISQGARSITLDECSIESTFSITSEYFEKNDFLIGSYGAICMGYDTSLIEEDSSWDSFEIGVYAGYTGSQDSLEMTSGNSKIYYNYDKVLLYGLRASYAYKLFDSQYIGAKIFVATSSESYEGTETSTEKSRNDGDPAIQRFGAGIYYAYRYHLKTELSAGINFISDSVTRNYTNTSYDASVTTANLEVGAGYYVLPYMKLWGSVASDASIGFGVSWVW